MFTVPNQFCQNVKNILHYYHKLVLDNLKKREAPSGNTGQGSLVVILDNSKAVWKVRP